MGVFREGPGKAKEGTVSVLEKGRKEDKRIRGSYKILQASMGPHWGSFRPHGALRERSIEVLSRPYWGPFGALRGLLGALPHWALYWVLMGSLGCLLGALGGLQSGPFGKGLERQKRVWCVLEKARKEENRIKGSFKTILSPKEASSGPPSGP
jgi:hypothetical protein